MTDHTCTMSSKYGMPGRWWKHVAGLSGPNAWDCAQTNDTLDQVVKDDDGGEPYLQPVQ
jgi:hypothetical protein